VWWKFKQNIQAERGYVPNGDPEKKKIPDRLCVLGLGQVSW